MDRNKMGLWLEHNDKITPVEIRGVLKESHHMFSWLFHIFAYLIHPTPPSPNSHSDHLSRPNSDDFMAHPFLPPLIRLLFAFLFLSSTIATSDVPFIVAHKKASLTRLKSGAERVSVSIDIYNQGSSYVLFHSFNLISLFFSRFSLTYYSLVSHL